jgi:hypothetical protein
MLRSAAWDALSLNARRFIDFLMVEYMSHAGTTNGDLIATYKQLEKFGINKHQIRGAIRRAEDVGLVDSRKGPRKVATRYALTWLPIGDAPPLDRWKFYRGCPIVRLEPAVQKHSTPPETGGDLPPETGGEKARSTPGNWG